MFSQKYPHHHQTHTFNQETNRVRGQDPASRFNTSQQSGRIGNFVNNNRSGNTAASLFSSPTTRMSYEILSAGRRTGGATYRFDPYDHLLGKIFYGLTAYPNANTPSRSTSPIPAASLSSDVRVDVTMSTLIPSGTGGDEKNSIMTSVSSNATTTEEGATNTNNSTSSRFSSPAPSASSSSSSVVVAESSSPSLLPPGTIHTELEGKVNFFPYPETAFVNNSEPPAHIQKSQMTRMFIGQLPYEVTEMQLGWIAYVFGGGTDLFHFEQIVRVDKKKRNKDNLTENKKIPTGCYHAHVLPEQAAQFMTLLHKKMLIDDTGVWYCGNPTTGVIASTPTAVEPLIRARESNGTREEISSSGEVIMSNDEEQQEAALDEYCKVIKGEAVAAQLAAAEAKRAMPKKKKKRNKKAHKDLLDQQDQEEQTDVREVSAKVENNTSTPSTTKFSSSSPPPLASSAGPAAIPLSRVPAGRPFSSVVVQLATSTFDPDAPPATTTAESEEREDNKKAE